jgi:hypothetical protein
MFEMMRKKQRLFSMEAASPNTKAANMTSMEQAMEKVSVSSSYSGASADIKKGRELVCEKEIKSHICLMRRKQMLSEGNRSHPTVVKIDALSSTLTLPSQEAEVKKLLRHFVRGWDIDEEIKKIQKKQRLYDGTSDDPQLHMLNKFLMKADYPAAKEDSNKAQRYIYDYPSLFQNQLDMMRRKQKRHDKLKPYVALCLSLKHGTGHFVYRQDVLRARIFSFLIFWGEKHLYLHSEARTSGRMSLSPQKM